MYPRNAASPERISIGPVVQISDGAVQAAGVTVRVLPFGGSEADGVGTVAYSTDGVVVYTPTQAETNYTSFVLIAKKTGCIPASVSVVTSASNVAGHAGTDHSKVQNATSTVNFSGTTIKTATDIETDTQDIQARLPAALVDGRMVALAQEVADKTGFKLASDGLDLVTSWTVAITGNITGNLSGSVGSIVGVTFPANFGDLGIAPTSGAILKALIVEELAASALVSDGAGAPIAGFVWDAAYASHTTAGSFGKLMDTIRKSNTVVEGEVTNATVPSTTTFSSNVAYATGAFKHAVLLWLSGNLAEQNSPILTYNSTNGQIVVEEAFTQAPAVGDEFIIVPTTHVHSIMAIADGVAAIQVLSRLDSMIESDGAGQFRFDTIALSMAPAGGGGGGGTDWTTAERTAFRSILGFDSSGNIVDPSVGILDEIRDDIAAIGINVYPVSASTPERVAGTTLTFYRDESRSVSVVTDFTLTSLTLRFVVEDQDGADVLVVPNGSISRSGQTFTVGVTSAVTGTVGNYRWSMRDITTGDSVIAFGVLTVQEAASNG